MKNLSINRVPFRAEQKLSSFAGITKYLHCCSTLKGIFVLKDFGKEQKSIAMTSINRAADKCTWIEDVAQKQTRAIPNLFAFSVLNPVVSRYRRCTDTGLVTSVGEVFEMMLKTRGSF